MHIYIVKVPIPDYDRTGVYIQEFYFSKPPTEHQFIKHVNDNFNTSTFNDVMHIIDQLAGDWIELSETSQIWKYITVMVKLPNEKYIESEIEWQREKIIEL